MTMHTDYSNFKARQKGEYEKAWQSTGKCVFCDLRDKYIIYEKTTDPEVCNFEIISIE